MINCNNVLCILISIATFITVLARKWNVNILKDSKQFFLFMFLCANTVFVYYNVKFYHEFLYPCYAIPVEIKQVIKQMSLYSNVHK